MHPDENIILIGSRFQSLFTEVISGHQVHLSAVIPTVPVVVSSSASIGLEQSFAGLSVSSNPTTVVSNLQTGTLSSLTVSCVI